MNQAATNNSICKAHSGCIADIEHLQGDNEKQWKELTKMNNRVDKIFNRINLILGGIVVSCVMLVINLLK